MSESFDCFGRIEVGGRRDALPDLTLAEQSERRRKEYLDAGDLETRRRNRGEEQVKEVERVLLKYVLSYDEEGRKVDWTEDDDDEEEEEDKEEDKEEEENVDVCGGERESKKVPVTDQASWLYAVEILARERSAPECAQEWIEKRCKRGGCRSRGVRVHIEGHRGRDRAEDCQCAGII